MLCERSVVAGGGEIFSTNTEIIHDKLTTPSSCCAIHVTNGFVVYMAHGSWPTPINRRVYIRSYAPWRHHNNTGVVALSQLEFQHHVVLHMHVLPSTIAVAYRREPTPTWKWHIDSEAASNYSEHLSHGKTTTRPRKVYHAVSILWRRYSARTG